MGFAFIALCECAANSAMTFARPKCLEKSAAFQPSSDAKPLPEKAIARLFTPKHKGAEQEIHYLAFSNTGQELISGLAYDILREHCKTACRWETKTWLLSEESSVGAYSHYFHARGISFDHSVVFEKNDDGKLQLLATKNRKVLLNLTEKERKEFNGLSADGTIVKLTEIGEEALIFRFVDVASKSTFGPVTLDDLHDTYVLSPDRRLLAWNCIDGTVCVADVKTGKDRFHLKTVEQPRKYGYPHHRALIFSKNGKYLATWDSYLPYLRVWDVAKRASICTIPAAWMKRVHRWDGICAEFSPDERTLAIGGDFDGTVTVWEIMTSKQRLTLKGHSRPVTAVTFSANGELLATGSDDTTILVWNLIKSKRANGSR